jgi:hypothetical protein
MDLPDGAPPEPLEEPVLPGDDVEVKYFGVAPEDAEAEEGAEVVSSADGEGKAPEGAEDPASDDDKEAK